jgi:histone acetyltransferase SAS3
LLTDIPDAKHWRCTACIQNDLHEDEQEEDEPSDTLTQRRLSEAYPKLARDLLPSQRGVDPAGHSIFKELILPDDPPDGSRALRKRKASHEEEVQPPTRTIRKKRRPSEASKSSAVRASVGASSPPVPARSTRSVKSVMTNDHETDGDAQQSGTDEEGNRPRSRARRSKPQGKKLRPLAWVDEENSTGLSLMMVFHLNNEQVQKIVTAKPKKKILTIDQEKQERRRERDRERRERNRRAAQAARESPELAQYPIVQHHYAAPFHGFSEKEDETKSKPYGGVLSEADADTSKTYPTQADRKRFDDARAIAEEEWKKKQARLYANPEPVRSHKQATTASKIKCVSFGGWEIDTWHAAPYPEEYSKNRVLYICEFCLKYMNSDYVAWRHKVCIRTVIVRMQFLTIISSSALQSTLQVTRSIVMARTLSSRSTAGRIQSTARTFVYSPSFSWARRLSTTTWNPFCFML